MKKILISILIVLLLILCIVAITSGIPLSGMEILSISQIQDSKNALDKVISDATVAASTDYKNALDNINADIKKLEAEKKNYEDMVTITTDDEQKITNQYQKYEIEYLWATVGNHATKEGVVIKMDIVAGTGADQYNLNFTVNGTYIGITEFISDIENDSALGFKIEDFSMQPGASTDSLETTFTCKNIEIKNINGNTSSSQSSDGASGNINDETNSNSNSNTSTNTNTNSNSNADTSATTTTTTGQDTKQVGAETEKNQ